MELHLNIIGPDEHPSRKQEIDMMMEVLKLKINDFYKLLGLNVNKIYFNSTSSASKDAEISFDIEKTDKIYPIIFFDISTLGRGVYGPSKRALKIIIRIKNVSTELEELIYNHHKLRFMSTIYANDTETKFSYRVEDLLGQALKYFNTYQDYANAYDLFVF